MTYEMEKFSLKWNDFSSKVQKCLENLRKEEDLFDVMSRGLEIYCISIVTSTIQK